LDYDRRVENLSSDAYRLFMLTLYSRGRTMLGVMRFVAADAVARVRAWDEGAVQAALNELLSSGLVEYDQEARLLFNPMALEFAPVKGLNQVRGALAVLREFPDSPVLLPALEHVMAAAEAESRGKARDTLRDLPELLAELGERRAALAGPADKPLPTPSTPRCQGVSTPLAPPPEGVDSPLIPPAEGVGMGSQGGPEGLDRGSRACACPRGRARAPDPDPEPEEPPQTPPPETAGATVGAAGGKGQGGVKGASRYELLDPRKRDGGSGPNGAATKQAGTGDLPGLRSTGGTSAA
jgi:hypothetical protein